MENLENMSSSKERMSEQEMAQFLLEKYPNEIKSVETFDAGKIMVYSMPLPEIETFFKENIEDKFEIEYLNKFIKYLHSPIIVDSFPDYRNDGRHNFIKEVTKENNDLKQFFDNNKLKISNPRSLVMAYMLLGNLPDALVERSKELYEEILSPGSYDSMSVDQKMEIVHKIDDFCADIIKYFLQKYSKEK